MEKKTGTEAAIWTDREEKGDRSVSFFYELFLCV